jgi:hypothetical protein
MWRLNISNMRKRVIPDDIQTPRYLLKTRRSWVNGLCQEVQVVQGVSLPQMQSVRVCACQIFPLTHVSCTLLLRFMYIFNCTEFTWHENYTTSPFLSAGSPSDRTSSVITGWNRIIQSKFAYLWFGRYKLEAQ